MHCYFAFGSFIFLVKMIALVNGGYPPWISSEFNPKYYSPMFLSSPLTLRCKTRDREVRYQWLKDDIRLQTNNQIVVNERNGEIIFYNHTKRDFGNYHCIAQNEYGASVSLYFELIEEALGGFSEDGNETKICLTNDYCNLTCKGKPYCEPSRDCKIEWKIGTGTSNPVKNSKSIMIDREGTLHFLNINASNGDKQYTCNVWNEKRRILRRSSLVSTIQVNDTIRKSEQLIHAYSGNFKAFLGETAILQCIFSGNPIPSITWYNAKGFLITPTNKYKIREYDRELQIINVTFDDEGVFKCISDTNKTKRAYLNVTSPPVFPGVEGRFLVKYVPHSNKEKLVLQCNAKSAPNESDPVVIKWMRNGKSITTKNRTLHISQNTAKEKGGCYTCIAKNSEGIAVANFLLLTSDDQSIFPVVMSALTVAVLILLAVFGILVKRTQSKRGVESKSQQLNITNNSGHNTLDENGYADPDIELSHLHHVPVEVDISGHYDAVSPIYHNIDDSTEKYYSVVNLVNDCNFASPGIHGNADTIAKKHSGYTSAKDYYSYEECPSML